MWKNWEKSFTHFQAHFYDQIVTFPSYIWGLGEEEELFIDIQSYSNLTHMNALLLYVRYNTVWYKLSVFLKCTHLDC